MLKNALSYKDEVDKLFYTVWYDERYKYYFVSGYSDNINWPIDNYKDRQFVSVTKDDKVIGYIQYRINRADDSVDSIHIINFHLDNKELSLIFAMDLKQCLKDIFDKYNHRKIVFCCVVGNPAMPHYERLVKSMGGRVVGEFFQDTKLIDGKYYNTKFYEIFQGRIS